MLREPRKVLSDLPPFDGAGSVNVVVEAPRGTSIKLEFDPKLGAFTVARALPLGLTYPFDWGFVPGTRADDGDPVDALAMHDAATYPGVLLPCRVLGMVALEEDSEDGARRQVNNRVIAIPTWHDRIGDLTRPADLPARIRIEIERFFLSATFFTPKNASIKGWRGKKATEAFLRRSAKR